MRLKIKTFGMISELIAGDQVEVDGIPDTAHLREWLKKNYPAIDMINYQIAVDRKITRENVLLEQSMEIALLPPFSGG